MWLRGMVIFLHVRTIVLQNAKSCEKQRCPGPVNRSAVFQAKNWTNRRAFMFWTINQPNNFVLCSTIKWDRPKFEQLSGRHSTWIWIFFKSLRYQMLSLWWTNSMDEYSEKYGMMRGLVQKPVTAPVVPIPVLASDWPAELLSFWLSRASPAAELLIGQHCPSSSDSGGGGRNQWKSTSRSASTSHILSNHL